MLHADDTATPGPAHRTTDARRRAERPEERVLVAWSVPSRELLDARDGGATVRCETLPGDESPQAHAEGAAGRPAPPTPAAALPRRDPTSTARAGRLGSRRGRRRPCRDRPCGEADRPCAHLVALWEAAAARIEADPFALLHLRGRGRQRFLADLSAARRAQGTAREDRITLDALPVERWTRAQASLEDLEVAPPPRPDVTAGPLRLLGDPPGWAGTVSAHEAFAPPVEAAARYAERVARGGEDR